MGRLRSEADWSLFRFSGAWNTRRRRPVSGSSVRSPGVAAEWMVVGDFHESDSHAIGICDPHLDQSPWLPSGRLSNRHAGGRKPLMLRSDIPHVQPERQTHRWRLGLTGDLQQPVSQEEDEPRSLRWAELPVHGEAEDVAVERLGPRRIRRSQQDAAAQHLHAGILAQPTGVRGRPRRVCSTSDRQAASLMWADVPLTLCGLTYALGEALSLPVGARQSRRATGGELEENSGRATVSVVAIAGGMRAEPWPTLMTRKAVDVGGHI